MRHHTVITTAILILLSGCETPSNEFNPKQYDAKRYSDRDLNAVALRDVVRNRTGRALAHMRVLEELRSGSGTNAIDILEAELTRDVGQLQVILKTSDVCESNRGD